MKKKTRFKKSKKKTPKKQTFNFDDKTKIFMKMTKKFHHAKNTENGPSRAKKRKKHEGNRPGGF
jgi:hypothetical protein